MLSQILFTSVKCLVQEKRDSSRLLCGSILSCWYAGSMPLGDQTNRWSCKLLGLDPRERKRCVINLAFYPARRARSLSSTSNFNSESKQQPASCRGRSCCSTRDTQVYHLLRQPNHRTLDYRQNFNSGKIYIKNCFVGEAPCRFDGRIIYFIC